MKVIIRIRHDLIWPGPNGEDRFPHRCTLDWQTNRRRLFERYTLPSLRKQTHADWEAWLLADPANSKLHTAAWGDLGPRTMLVYEPDARARCLDQDVFLMRIDSDDVLAVDAIENLVAHAHLGKPFVQLDTGVAWDERNGVLYSWTNPAPPFYGRIATKEELSVRLPGLGHHVQVRYLDQCHVLQTEQPSFCVILHGGNISNHPDRAWCHSPYEGEERARLMQRFGL